MRCQSTVPDALGGFCRRRVCLFCSLCRAVLVYAHRVERSTHGGGCVCRCRSFGSLAIMAEGLSLVCLYLFYALIIPYPAGLVNTLLKLFNVLVILFLIYHDIIFDIL